MDGIGGANPLGVPAMQTEWLAIHLPDFLITSPYSIHDGSRLSMLDISHIRSRRTLEPLHYLGWYTGRMNDSDLERISEDLCPDRIIAIL